VTKISGYREVGFRQSSTLLSASRQKGRRGNVWVNTPIRSLKDDIAQVLRPTKFGACWPQGSTAADVVTKFGQKAFIRYFAGTPTSTPPAKVIGASGCHISWSFGITVTSGLTGTALSDRLASNNAIATAIINGTYDAQITASVTGLDVEHWRVEAIHELDTKYNNGQLSLTLGQQAKTKFYNVVKAANPGLLVVLTLQGYSFSNSNTSYTNGTTDSRYGAIPHDVIGLDVDGIQPPKSANGDYILPYPSLAGRATNAQKWMRDHGASRYAFPEWGVTTTCIDDPNNTTLANSWISYYGQLWVAEPIAPDFACWYDYGGNPENASITATDLLTKPAAINALKALVAGYATRSGDSQPPVAPSSVTITNETASGFKVVWPPAQDNVAVAGYIVLLNGSLYSTTDQVALDVIGRVAGTTYQVQVQAYDSAGNYSDPSVAVPAVTTAAVTADTIAPTAPGTPVITNITTTGFTASWAPSTDAVGVVRYGVQLNGSTWGRTTGTTLNVTGLNVATDYSVRVVANDAALNYSLPSNAVPVRTETVATGGGSGGTTGSAFIPAWDPPQLENPITINVTNTNHGLKLDSTKDYLLVMPPTVLDVGAGNFSINGGRRVVLIGGEMTAAANDNGAIRATNQIEYLHIEGLKISGTVPDLAEGIQLQSQDTCIVQLINIETDQVTGSYEGHHADIVQTWGGGPFKLRIDGLTGRTDYQGWMLQSGSLTTAGTVPTGWDFRHINIIHAPNGLGWIMYDADPPAANIDFTEVYFEGNDNSGIYSLGHGGGKPGLTYGAPPFGNWVTTAGIGYTRPVVGDTTAPSVPTNVVASNVTTSGFNLAWTPSTDAVGVTGYDVQLNGISYASPTGASVAVTGKPASTTYTIRVRARDAAGNYSALSDPITQATATPAAAPVPTLDWRALGDNGSVSVGTTNAVSVRLRASTNSAGTTGLIYSSAVTPTSFGVSKPKLNGLNPAIRYWFKVGMTDSNGVETWDTKTALGRIQVAPTPGTPTSFTVYQVACCNGTDSAAMAAIAARDDGLLLLHRGDKHYKVGDPSRTGHRGFLIEKQAAPNHEPVYAMMQELYSSSDHDSTQVNNGNGFTDPTSMANFNLAYDDLYATPTRPAGHYYAKQWGRVLFLNLDSRTFCSDSNLAESATKSLLGLTQEQWVRDQLAAAKTSGTVARVALLGDAALNGPGTLGDDSWMGYTAARSRLFADIAAAGIPADYFAGDMHALAVDTGANNTGGIPVFQSAPLNNTTSIKGGPYSGGTYPTSTGSNAQLYAQLVYTDDGTNITLAWKGFSSDNVQRLAQTITTGPPVTPPAGTAPVASFTGTPLSGTVPFAVQFTDTSTGTPTSWLWSFGDGTTSTVQNPSHTYSTAGTYTVSVTATNATGSSASSTRTVTASAATPPSGGSIAPVGTPGVYEFATGTSVVIPLPTGYQVGNRLVAVVAHSSTAVIATPAGWDLDVIKAATASVSLAQFSRIATASEPASYTFPTNATAGRVSGLMVALSGVNTTTWLDATPTSVAASGTSSTVPSLNTVTANAFLLTAYVINASASADGVIPTGFTELARNNAAGAGVGRRLVLAYKVQATPGATGTVVWANTPATSLAQAATLTAYRPA
jgi:PKD repeat protein